MMENHSAQQAVLSSMSLYVTQPINYKQGRKKRMSKWKMKIEKQLKVTLILEFKMFFEFDKIINYLTDFLILKLF